MIECIFTIDYEIYGNGEGSLRELIFEPARQLQRIFNEAGVKIVVFVEAAELEKIETAKTDPAITDVKQQIQSLYKQGHEIALHLHPQWCKGQFNNGKWALDNGEYNLCVLPEQRIVEIVDGAIKYLRTVLSEPDFSPLSFRAGNWLFQPTQPIAKALSQRGITVDSSVFKGGLQHQHQLDYRPAVNNGYFWKFQDNVNLVDPNGTMMEIPIYVQMVSPWKLATKKRLDLQQKASSGIRTAGQKIDRLLDFMRFRQPLKLDFCRMTIEELTGMMDKIIQDDARDPISFKPIVAIGHTKDLMDFETIAVFLSYLKQRQIKVSTFTEVYNKIVVG